MKYKRINPPISSDFAHAILAVRGLSEDQIPQFIHPDKSLLNDPEQLTNIADGALLLFNALQKQQNIWIIVDCDVDGYTSASILWLYIKDIYPNAKLHYLVHEQKQHGLDDLVGWIEEHNKEIDLLIIPDAGSNDDSQFTRLLHVSIPCLVLDHHEIEGEISEDAIIINNQYSKNYPNKALTGAGVVYQFCRYLDRMHNTNYADKYLDLAALGIISDMGSVLELENRYIISKGLDSPNKNKFFKEFLEKQSFSIGATLSPIGVAWYVTPLINALIRVGEQEDKEKLFEAFIEPNKIVPSTKRGEKGLDETLATQMVRTCVNARNQQNKLKESVVADLERKIVAKNLLDNRILFIRLDKSEYFPMNLNGLVAMQLAAKYKRPTIVARMDGEGKIKGSARGLNDSALVNFKAFLQESELFDMTAGHANAFGIEIDNKKLETLHQFANVELADYDFNEEFFDVNFIYSAKTESEQIARAIYELDTLKETYGQGNPVPIFAIPDLSFSPSREMQVMGKNSDTLKIVKNGIAYMKFFAKDLIAELQKYDHVRLEIVGKGNVNEYYGTTTPQIFIEEYNIIDDYLEF